MILVATTSNGLLNLGDISGPPTVLLTKKEHKNTYACNHGTPGVAAMVNPTDLVADQQPQTTLPPVIPAPAAVSNRR